MKIQVALDLPNWKDAFKIAKKVKDNVDIIELGTPLVKNSGLGILKKFKKLGRPVVADLKTMDTGLFEAKLAFDAGADISTVCAGAPDETILMAIKAGKKFGKKIYVDLIGVKDPVKRVKEIKKMNPDYFCVHTGIDMQNEGKGPLETLKEISKVVSSKKIVVAGGVNLENIGEMKKYKPGIIIIGGAITKAEDPEEISRRLKEIVLSK